jgi:hypothetical protein
MVVGRWLVPQGLLPPHEGALKASKESDLAWGSHVQFPGFDGGQDPP